MFTDQVITPTFSDDVANLVGQVAKSGARGAFHAVGPEWLTPYEAAVEVAQHLGLDASLIPITSLAEHVDNGGRPFPQTLRLSNAATLSMLHSEVNALRDALRIPGWSF